MMWSAEEHERGFVENFIKKASRERYNYMLGVKKRRKKLASRFGYTMPVIEKWVVPIDGKMPTDDLCTTLKRHGATDICYMVSPDPSTDGTFVNLRDVISEEPPGTGILLSCVPGKVAIVVAEGYKSNYIYLLKRDR